MQQKYSWWHRTVIVIGWQFQLYSLSHTHSFGFFDATKRLHYKRVCPSVVRLSRFFNDFRSSRSNLWPCIRPCCYIFSTPLVYGLILTERDPFIRTFSYSYSYILFGHIIICKPRTDSQGEVSGVENFSKVEKTL